MTISIDAYGQAGNLPVSASSVMRPAVDVVPCVAFQTNSLTEELYDEAMAAARAMDERIKRKVSYWYARASAGGNKPCVW